MKFIYYVFSFFLFITVNTVVTARCLSLEEYKSVFDSISLTNASVLKNKIDFSTSANLETEKCFTIARIGNEDLDRYPSPNDVEDTCDEYVGHHEISLIKSVAYNKFTGLLGVLVINEFTASLPSGGMHPYFGYHLYIYRGVGKKFYALPKLNKIGWGDGLLIGNQTRETRKMECESKGLFKFSKPKEIEEYLAQALVVKKSYLYKISNKKTKMYLIKGDKVTLLDEKTDDSGQKWYFINYKGKKDLNMWIKAEAVDDLEGVKEKTKKVEPTEKSIPKKPEPVSQTKPTETIAPLVVAKQKLNTKSPQKSEAIIAKKIEATKKSAGSFPLSLLAPLFGLLVWRMS